LEVVLEIKPIETLYAGHRFRSRTEARWAILFDELKIPWEYEPEGFELEDGSRYLPDFRIVIRGDYSLKIWVEIKGVEPNKREIKNLHAVARGTAKPGLFFIGQPGSHKIYDCCLDLPVEHCMELYGTDEYALRRGLFLDRSIIDVLCAIDVARSARFEFGETT
jgi:hypothetical protein